MDTIGHALWTYIIYIAHPKKWWAVLIGVAPDIVSFIPHLFFEHFSGGQAVFDLVYQYTHSLIIFAIVFAAIWLFTKSTPLILGAWGIHIVFDIFTHPFSYYPTPYLFPFNSPEVLAIDYRSTTFLVINYAILASIFLYLYFIKKKSK
jgi:hypothetical protein